MESLGRILWWKWKRNIGCKLLKFLCQLFVYIKKDLIFAAQISMNKIIINNI